MQIIETTAGQQFRVRDAGSADLAHAWLGIEINKRTQQPKKNAREILVRRAGARLIPAGKG
jgi:hypothetical protein